MPLRRYLLYVGGVLLALLFIADAYFPKLPVAEKIADTDKPVIRIHSDRKWPEPVVFDTGHPTIVPSQTANVTTSIPPAPPVADVPAKAQVRDAFAELQLSDQKQAQPSEPKLEKKVQRKRRVAKRRVAPLGMLMAQQPQFGFFGNKTWHSTW